jgi:hypothetical protein
MFATRVKQGKYQVVEVTYNKNGNSNIKEISEWIPISESALNHGIPSNIELVAGTKYESLFKV